MQNTETIYNKTLITTEDGSHSIFVPELNEHYHSTHGAIQESMHVFIESGLKEILKSKNNISIFEMGFGTGLNAYLTLLYCLNQPVNIEYTTVEGYPIDEEIFKNLNYGAILENNEVNNHFTEIHASNWEQWSKIAEGFQLKKIKTSLLDYKPLDKFDLVYFDAFAPNVQPELWTAGIFENIFAMMNDGGILVTYCCKGEVKRNMKAAGFHIEKLPGPPGKREILRAWKL